MSYDSQEVAAKLRRWEKYLHNYQLPYWEEIPNIGLYMEQVLVLLIDYLDYLPPELKDEQFVTPATINNYVRNKIMPSPVKKKYYRVHIAYLIVICSLKQRLNIATIHRMMPTDISEEEVAQIYNSYVSQQKKAGEYFIKQVRMIAAPILDHTELISDLSVENTEDLISISAISSCLSGLLAEKLLYLDVDNAPEEKQKGKNKEAK